MSWWKTLLVMNWLHMKSGDLAERKSLCSRDGDHWKARQSSKQGKYCLGENNVVPWYVCYCNDNLRDHWTGLERVSKTSCKMDE